MSDIHVDAVELKPLINGDTPTLRLFSLLEVIAEKSTPFTLQNVADDTGIPKPTAHRMLQQLESAGILQRTGNGRHYSVENRLMRLAENLLINNTTQGARHAVLSNLVREVGESCNITALSGGEVLYLDRVETPQPLRFYLHSGSRVPAHCSATGKLFLSQMTPSQRKRLMAAAPLEQFTRGTITDYDLLETEIEQVRKQGYAFDREEFLPGLLCIGVLIPSQQGKSNMGLAVQAPVIRLDEKKALGYLPALRAAAEAIAKINQDVTD